MRSFASLALAVGAALALASYSAFALVTVPGTGATFEWTPSTGSVKSYLVEVSRNSGAFNQEKTVSEPRVTLSGDPGEKLSIRVIALGWSGTRSAPSPTSDTIEFAGSGGVDGGGSGTDVSGTDVSGTDVSGTEGSGTDVSGTDDVWNGAYGGSSPPPPPLPSAQPTMPYDFNGDGRTDLLWHNRQTNAAAVWLMNGTSPSQIVDLGTVDPDWYFAGSGDFDGDGYADLLMRQYGARKIAIWFIDEGGIQNADSFDGRNGDIWTVDAIGDFDGDGYADLLWRKTTRSLFWLMRGSTRVGGSEGPTVEEPLTAVCALELDGDGRSDLIWNGSRETVAWLMDGSWPWRSGPAGPFMGESQAVGCGDADGDGLGDVLWYHPESRRGTLWVMDGDIGMDLSFELPQLQVGWAMEASGDFDGDGLANEILLRNATSGSIEIWELQWNGSRTSFSIATTAGTGMGSGDWQVVAP